MLALAYYRAQCCPSGHYLPESTRKDLEFAYRSEGYRCHACTAVAAEATRISANPHPSAVLFTVRR